MDLLSRATYGRARATYGRLSKKPDPTDPVSEGSATPM